MIEGSFQVKCAPKRCAVAVLRKWNSRRLNLFGCTPSPDIRQNIDGLACHQVDVKLLPQRNSFQVEDGSMVGTTDLPNARSIVVLQCSPFNRQSVIEGLNSCCYVFYPALLLPEATPRLAFASRLNQKENDETQNHNKFSPCDDRVACNVVRLPEA